MTDWRFWLPSWFVPKAKQHELAKRAELTGTATESRTFLWGIIEIGTVAELRDKPPVKPGASPPTSMTVNGDEA